MIQVIEYLWNVNTNQCVVNSRQKSTFGENDESISNSQYIWDLIGNQLVGIYKIELTHDKNGNPDTEMTYRWDTIADNWANAIKKTYYYSEYNPTIVPGIPGKTIVVYPNPAKDFIVFDVSNNLETVIVEIFDIQGKKVLEQEISGHMKISVSNLAKGLYMYKLKQKGTIYKGKLLIE